MASPFAQRGSFLVYNAFRSEVATARIVSALLAAGKEVRLPRVCGDKLLALPFGETEVSPLGVREPVAGEDGFCEVALVPLLAFDGEGYRLGYGGGYYDRYLARNPATVRVGLAYAGQAVEALPREAHDVPLDALVTERGVRIYENRLTARALSGYNEE